MFGHPKQSLHIIHGKQLCCVFWEEGEMKYRGREWVAWEKFKYCKHTALCPVVRDHWYEPVFSGTSGVQCESFSWSVSLKWTVTPQQQLYELPRNFMVLLEGNILIKWRQTRPAYKIRWYDIWWLPCSSFYSVTIRLKLKSAKLMTFPSAAGSKIQHAFT